MSEGTHTFTVGQDQDGGRLDKTVAAAVPALSRTRIRGLIESSCVSVDDVPVQDPNFRVKTPSSITVEIPAPEDSIPKPQPMALDIRYEDEHLIVINKPPGLVVHPAAGNPDHTLVNALLAHCGDSLRGIGGVKRPGIVHRLDKDTSGLLVAAKTEPAHAGLAEQFAAHSIDRRYAALIWGVPSPLSGTLTGAIGRSRANRKKMAVVKTGGKPAITHYATQRSFPPHASLVECRLETGRTHQIRVHMTENGTGIVGDPVYGRGLRRGISSDLADAVRTFGRQALHAGVLGFTHPVSDQDLKFEADVPDDMATLISVFEHSSRGK